MDQKTKALELHRQHPGKLEIKSLVSITNKEELALAYTPGVAEPCLKIKENSEDVYHYTAKGRSIAVISDGSAVLGLGNIGPLAAIPVMEGKAILFKEFANIDAIPLCLDTQNVDDIVQTIKNLAPSFGGINLEDISAPRCFEVERRLQEVIDIPVFHDDQHGTAIVVAAALINALKLSHKSLYKIKVVISGAGAAGTAIARMLLSLGCEDIILTDIKGVVSKDERDLEDPAYEIAQVTNLENIKGSLKDVLVNADVFIGVSAPNLVSEAMVASMAQKAIVFALANPTPEIMPDVAKKAGAFIVGTGRSDFPNQINNVLAFPGVFKGALSARAKRITESMKRAAVFALANILEEEELTQEYILPSLFDTRVVDAVSKAVELACKETL